NDVIQACRKLDIPIIYTRQLNRSDQINLSKGEPIMEDGTPFYYSTSKENHEILDEITPKEEDIIIDKYRWSAFFETSLDGFIKIFNVKNRVCCGVLTDICVITTFFDSFFRDYHVHLIKDLCTTSNEGAHMASLMIMSYLIYTLEVHH